MSDDVEATARALAEVMLAHEPVVGMSDRMGDPPWVMCSCDEWEDGTFGQHVLDAFRSAALVALGFR